MQFLEAEMKREEVAFVPAVSCPPSALWLVTVTATIQSHTAHSPWAGRCTALKPELSLPEAAPNDNTERNCQQNWKLYPSGKPINNEVPNRAKGWRSGASIHFLRKVSLCTDFFFLNSHIVAQRWKELPLSSMHT